MSDARHMASVDQLRAEQFAHDWLREDEPDRLACDRETFLAVLAMQFGQVRRGVSYDVDARRRRGMPSA